MRHHAPDCTMTHSPITGRESKPEPGKRFIETFPLGATVYFFDGRAARVERHGPGSTTVSFEVERTIVDKVVRHRERQHIARHTQVKEKP